MLRVAIAGAVTVTALALTAPDHGPLVFGDVTPLGAPVLVAHESRVTSTTNPPTTSSRAEPAPTPTTTPSTTPAPPSSTAAPKPSPKPTVASRKPTVATTSRAPSVPSGRYRCTAAVSAIAAAGAFAASLTTWDAIAWRESRCQLAAVRAVGGDYSVCWWQIEYGHGLGATRTRAYGPPSLLQSSPSACANAALSLYRAAGWSPWG